MSNEFWKKKAYRAIQVRDVNKDGYISMADFDLLVQRYKDMGTPEEHLKKISEFFTRTFSDFGMTDESVKLTYDQFAAGLAGLSKNQDENARIGVFKTMFEIIDSDGNGEISYGEWVNYYKAVGIDTKHARASFDAMDTDHNGTISDKEFAAYVNEFFHSAEDKLKSSILYGPLD